MMLHRHRLWLWLGIVAVTIFGITRLYFRTTDDFRIGNITYEMPYHQEWEIPPLSSEEKNQLESILAQKWYYIGKGAQSYAFHSADDKYVLKFFKFKHLRPNWVMNLMPPLAPLIEYRHRQAVRKDRKLYGVFDGYRLAYAVHKNESGLLFIHLNTTHNLHKTTTVFDKIGLHRTIHLDDVVFIVQEKAQTTRSVINDALKKGELSLAQRRIRQIIDLYLAEYQKGIYDKDHGVMHNTGFVGDRPIHLDVGKLTKEPEMTQPQFWQPDLERIGWKFALWIKESYPQYYPAMAKDLEGKLSDTFGHRYDFASNTPPPPRKKR